GPADTSDSRGRTPAPRPSCGTVECFPTTGVLSQVFGSAGKPPGALLKSQVVRGAPHSCGMVREVIVTADAHEAPPGFRRGLACGPMAYRALLRTASRNAVHSRAGMTRWPRWGFWESRTAAAGFPGMSATSTHSEAPALWLDLRNSRLVGCTFCLAGAN